MVPWRPALLLHVDAGWKADGKAGKQLMDSTQARCRGRHEGAVKLPAEFLELDVGNDARARQQFGVGSEQRTVTAGDIITGECARRIALDAGSVSIGERGDIAAPISAEQRLSVALGNRLRLRRAQ
jgi:hypothetical protein